MWTYEIALIQWQYWSNRNYFMQCTKFSIFLSFNHFKLYFTIFMLAASISNEIEKFTFSWMTLKNKMNYTQGKRRETNLPTTDRHVFLNNNGLANFFMTTKIERIIYCSSNDFHIRQNLWNLSWFKFDSFRSWHLVIMVLMSILYS